MEKPKPNMLALHLEPETCVIVSERSGARINSFRSSSLLVVKAGALGKKEATLKPGELQKTCMTGASSIARCFVESNFRSKYNKRHGLIVRNCSRAQLVRELLPRIPTSPN